VAVGAKHRDNVEPLERLVFFSDAVFAIAITLLILEVDVPHLHGAAGNMPYWNALARLGPSLFAFVLSFLVIALFWRGHHQRFSAATRFDKTMLWPNTFYLLAVAFMPFATAFLGTNLGHFVPTLIYNLTLVATATLAWWLAVTVRRRGAVTDAAPFRDAPATVLAALVCVALTFVVAQWSQVGMATIPLWSRLLARNLGKASSKP
jgi:uncharacterized membrane protein